MKNETSAKKTTTTPATPKASEVKCEGCAAALLHGGRCAAHGDPKAAHANGVAATGTADKSKALRPHGAELTKKAQAAAGKVRETKATVADAGDDQYAHSRGAKEDTIKLLVDENPKTEGTKSYKRFAAYKNGMTVAEALAAGIKSADIRWDMAHGFIALK